MKIYKLFVTQTLDTYSFCRTSQMILNLGWAVQNTREAPSKSDSLIFLSTLITIGNPVLNPPQSRKNTPTTLYFGFPDFLHFLQGTVLVTTLYFGFPDFLHFLQGTVLVTPLYFGFPDFLHFLQGTVLVTPLYIS